MESRSGFFSWLNFCGAAVGLDLSSFFCDFVRILPWEIIIVQHYLGEYCLLFPSNDFLGRGRVRKRFHFWEMNMLNPKSWRFGRCFFSKGWIFRFHVNFQGCSVILLKS